MAFIHIYTGPMASGKTSKMLDILHRYSNVTKDRVLLINFLGDHRSTSTNGISTHLYGDYNQDLPLGKYIDVARVNVLFDVKNVEDYSIIGIDEAQFFPDLELFIKKYLTFNNLTFHISGLSYDSDNNIFGQINNILPYSTTYEKMSAICSRCDPKKMIPAGFTICNINKNDIITIGGLDIYQPVCLFHYYMK